MTTPRKPRHPLRNLTMPVRLGDFEPTRAKQSFKDECDINNIMAKFQRNGIVTHLAKYGPQYGQSTPTDLHEAMILIAEAQEMYDALPSTVRKKFPDPAAFLEYVQNPDNQDDLVELGLATKRADPAPIRVEIANPADPPEPQPET